MKLILQGIIALGLAGLAGFSAGCGVKHTPPEAIAAQDLPTQVREAFKDSAPELKTLVEKALTAFEAGNYPVAYTDFQTIAGRADLDGSQRDLAGRCILTANEKLLEAAKQGNQQATQMMRLHEVNK